jgi:hypothetical protein
MKPKFDPQQDPLQQFDAWLRHLPIEAPPDISHRVRRVLRENPSPDPETAIDELFQIDARLRDPNMAGKVRRRLKEVGQPVVNAPAHWFQWLSPLAATLVLGLTFFSFQQQAPEPRPAPQAPGFAHSQTTGNLPAEDPELTRIFALASNLMAPADMAELKSVDDLASLFH